MLLPWRKTTILGQVLTTLAQAVPGLEMVVVSGGAREQVSAEIQRLAQSLTVREAFNPQFASGHMLLSLQTGLLALQTSPAQAVFVTLGDQPQTKRLTLRHLLADWQKAPQQLILPSHQHRRGHPWLLPRGLWPELLALRPPLTLRDFLNLHAADTVYTPADESVLQDVDTREEYEKIRASQG